MTTLHTMNRHRNRREMRKHPWRFMSLRRRRALPATATIQCWAIDDPNSPVGSPIEKVVVDFRGGVNLPFGQ